MARQSNSLDAFNDTKSSSNCMRLRKIAAHLTALNAYDSIVLPLVI